MAAPRDQALSLLAAANNHGDLAVKLSSLRQAKGILLSLDPASAAELFPFLVELQYSPETLVRRSLIELVDEMGLKATEYTYLLMPILLTFLRDEDTVVSTHSIITISNLFCSVLEEMVLQVRRRGKVERWLEELWPWMNRFKDAVFALALEPGRASTRMLALKFTETYVLLFTSNSSETETHVAEGGRQKFNISWLVGGHPVLEPYILMSEANRTLGVLLNLLQTANNLPGSLMISVVNCLRDYQAGQCTFANTRDKMVAARAEQIWPKPCSLCLQYSGNEDPLKSNGSSSDPKLLVFALMCEHLNDILFDYDKILLACIARKRPLQYSAILTALLDFKTNPEMLKGSHAPSVIYSLRTAFLGFLRCTNPTILESRDQLIRALRAMNAGDAADQAVRHADKMIKNAERALRDARFLKDDQSSQLPVLGDTLKKRSVPLDNEDSSAKRLCYSAETYDHVRDNGHSNGVATDLPQKTDGELNPVEKMIAVIGALLAEGERGVESLDILVSKIHPDLLADIVITNMKHLPKMPFPAKLGNSPTPRPMNPLNGLSQAIPESPPRNSVQSPTLQSTLVTEMPSANTLPNDSKRDPRRDPRRLDPRRASVPAGLATKPTVDDANFTQFDHNGSNALTNPNSVPVDTKIEHGSGPLKTREEETESQAVHRLSQSTPKDEVIEELEDLKPAKHADTSPDPTDSPVQKINDTVSAEYQDFPAKDEVDESPFFEFDDRFAVSNIPESEETCKDLPQLPLFVELSKEQQESVRKLAINRIIDSYKHPDGTECSQMRLELLARLVAQIDADDEVSIMLQKHVIVDYQEQKGHELVLHVLYHLYSLNTSFPTIVYEKFLLTVITALLDSLPASDKSFSKLLGEVPTLTDSALKLLGDLCSSDVTDGHGKDIRDIERVTQGLGAVWSLILGRPIYRQACLDIALKCAVHSQDEIRAKAIRLVANKLYQLTYISENIEQFATQMLMSAVVNEQNAGSVETSVSDSQVSDSGNSENDSTTKGRSTVSLLEAQRLISLYFALCTKKPDLLRLVFRIYGGAPKTAKQAFHRHIPILIRALGSSYSELLNIISDPPEGSENLLTLVLQILTQETTPSPDLIATVKHLYETKLKDVSILIPMLSSLSKTEVLPIFPRLIALPLEKFQMALAHILQGSAHTGPALTPAEVLVAIHGIVPERDSLPLKKITDACSACFEQRTVFTQQVLAKALSKMVDQTPLPLLFMRTVIQSIDAFPALVDFVMEILSKLVSKQVWKMPKLWVGFLKCVSQTQPHSFQVLLKLPPPPLENALNKHASLRTSLATYASQPSIRSSLPRQTLAVLGLANETHNQLPHRSSSDASSSVRGATPT